MGVLGMIFEIEKGVPIPNIIPSRSIYPFRDMEVGDSFFVKCHKNIYSTVTTHNKRNAPKIFTARKEGSGFRVWRIK